MATEKRLWTCPGCSRTFKVPVNKPDPDLCPDCRSQHSPSKPVPPALPTNPVQEHAPEYGFSEGQTQIEEPSTESVSTRPCKFCGNPVAPNATNCPKCGGKSPYPVSMKEWLIGAGGLFLLLFTCCIWFPRGCSGTGGDAEDRGRPVEAWTMAQQFVEKNLKSPSTADYGWQTSNDTVEELGNDRYRVTAWVDSQNSFGATIRTNFVCELRYVGGDKWLMESLKFDER